MKTPVMLALAAALAASGCGKGTGQDPKPAAAQGRKKSGAAKLIDDFTGKTAVQSGQRAKEKIRAISKESRKNLDDAMGQ